MEVKDCRVQLQNTVYIDSVFLANLVMDLYLLALTVKILGKPAAYARIFAGSAVGAGGYCIILCLPELPGTLRVLFGMIPVGALMIKIACRTDGIRELFRGMGYLYSFSFILGGFILFLKGRIGEFSEGGDSIAVLAGAAFGGFVLCRKGISLCQEKRRDLFCRVRLPGDDGPVEFRALIDTGNGLTEPVSQKPVAILDEQAWEGLRIWMRPEKYKIIPYHSLGKENGVMEGYEIDTMKVMRKESEKQYDKVIIAIFKGKVSGKGSYQMILPPELSV